MGGRATSAAAIEQALAFYTALGKKPIHIRREIKGHVANRLQAALWREAFYLVSQGIVSVSEVDTAIAHGPGLRWALLGPFLDLAQIDEDGRPSIVGGGPYIVVEAGRAEIAFVVVDAYQGQGSDRLSCVICLTWRATQD